MEPTIKSGEVVTVDIHGFGGSGLARWDVVVFEAPIGDGGQWISRVVGLPGEKVDIRNGRLVIDGQEVTIPSRLGIGDYRPPNTNLGPGAPGPVAFPFTVPAGSYFVLGDNVSNALDSRYWGALDGSKVLGTVLGK